ncbi:hypothetical protein YN1HA_6270 [Sulfurisphaera ohwakuensis]
MLGAKGFTTSMGSFSSLPLKIYENFQKGEINNASRLYDILLEYRSFIKFPVTMSHLAKLGAWMKGLIDSYATRPPLPDLDHSISPEMKNKIVEKINEINKNW